MNRIVLIALTLLAVAAAAPAYHPTREAMDRIVVLAVKLERATTHIYDKADRLHERFTGREERSFRRLGELHEQAHAFRSHVEANSSDSAAVADAFDDLVASYTRASSSLDDLDGHRELTIEFREVQRVMEQLTDELGGQDHFWGQHRHDGPAMLTISESTIISIGLRSKLRSSRLTDGDEFLASLAAPLEVNGRVIAAAGSDTLVKVVEMRRAGRAHGRERLTLELAGVRIGGRMQSVESSAVSFEADRGRNQDAAIIGGSAAAGAIVGILTNSDNRDEGALKGGLAGAAAGTGVVLLTRGKNVNLPAHQRIDFALTRSVRVRTPSSEREEPRRQSWRQ